MAHEIFNRLNDDDLDAARTILGDYRDPDLIIAPDGEPYLYRWHVIPRRAVGANVYFHIQTASDPDRPLHDHPWANQSVILAGCYDEVVQDHPPSGPTRRAWRVKGDCIQRPAFQAHRLILPSETPYTMTLFTTGPKVRDWGFWTPEGFVNNEDYTETLPDGRSVVKKEFLK